MINTKLKAIFFDLDDTLFDRDKAQREIACLIMQQLSNLFSGMNKKTVINAFLESDRIALEEFDAGGSSNVVRIGRSKRFLRMLGLDESFVEEITRMYTESYSKVYTPIKDAKRVVKTLAKEFKLGIISNGFPDVQYRKLKVLGFENLFQCIILSEEIAIQKPDPRIFSKAAVSLGVHLGESLYVGDSYDIDILGAKKAGMQACWFNPNNIHLPPEVIKPDIEIKALIEILKILGLHKKH